MRAAAGSGPLLIYAALGLAAGVALVLAPSALLGLLVLPALIGAVLLARGAFHETPAATFILIFMAVFLIDATFRTRDYADKGIDFQVLLKIGTWVIIVLVALLHASRWLPQMLLPSNMPVLMFLAWLMFTATVSPMPAYTAVAAFSICAYVLFCAYLFASFERAEIFAVMVLSITAFCLVSIAVYFAVPEFGRFTYWLNEQRYVSARMAGIAGSANNMGRFAAFGLIFIILYAREFRQMHRWFVPGASLILVAALVLTNSRTSMAMVLALWAAVYLLRWQRFYLLVLGVSALLLMAVALLPAGDEVLKLISRSGDMEELTSITGRSTIWDAIPRIVESRPWTGFGYATSVVVLPQHEREVGFLTSHAHNLALQLLLTTGWVGLGLFGLALFSTGLRLAVTGDRTGMVMLAYVLLNGITESSAFSTLANICTVAFAIAVTLPQERTYYDIDYPYQRRFS